MKLVTGQLKPSKGAVTVLGEPIWRNPGCSSASASAPTGRVLRPDDRPRVDMALVRLNGLDEKPAERPPRALGTVELLDAANKKIALQQGLRQRSAGQAIVHDRSC